MGFWGFGVLGLGSGWVQVWLLGFRLGLNFGAGWVKLEGVEMLELASLSESLSC